MIKHLAAITLLQLGLMAPALAMPEHRPSHTIVERVDLESAPRSFGEPQASRTIDSSAKGGNADETNHAVPNFGTTSGGPAD
ncbi:hypothetical protein [Methylobacterium sp. Leaf93]|uniref:hypothetical protein n=1 Tax=Methylobacterium sp. Leaf93 TaxID=1736249 RepID=UPI0006F6A32E|nr:hypothetical protein [Methylobacterium sp. Leaf93]KQP02709.1 hypothetical protein ASF26_14875 [Methylobacterium sp. Leaf93]